MHAHEVCGIKIYRPRLEAEMAVRAEAEASLRAKRAEGTYDDPKQINAVLQEHFRFFQDQLNQIIPRMGSRHLMEFVLHQYDISVKIDLRVKEGHASEEDLSFWSSRGPHFRRAMKYLAEITTMLSPPEAPSARPDEMLDLTDRLFICAEQLVTFAGLSDQTYMLFPDRTKLSIAKAGELDYLHLSVTPMVGQDFGERVRRDNHTRKKYVKLDYPLFDKTMRSEVLDGALTAVFGLPYQQCMGVLVTAANTPDNTNTNPPVPFVRQSLVNEAMQKTFGAPVEAIQRLLAGFTLTQHSMAKEGRAVWKPKQEYRAYRRGFFEFPHATGPHFTWAQGMANESLIFLNRDLAFQHLPPEWEEKPLRDAVAELSNRCGAVFEHVCQDLMIARGFPCARNYKDGIGLGAARIAIPQDVGELDCLAYSPALKMLVLLECKLVQSGTEPTKMRDDLAAFQGAKGYFAKFARKLNWVRENLSSVTVALASVEGMPSPIEPTVVAGAMVTLYSSFASYFSADIPCASIGEFFFAWDEKNSWPFVNGVYPANQER
jgi:hypothetical protein